MICYDQTSTESFANVKRWYEEIERYAYDTTKKILVGTKSDLVGQKKVSTNDAIALANEHKINYHSVSSKTGEGIDALFADICKMLITNQEPIKPKHTIELNGTQINQKKTCC